MPFLLGLLCSPSTVAAAKNVFKHKNKNAKRPNKNILNNPISSDEDSNIQIMPHHEGKKQFKCEFCNYTFFRNQFLKRHVASVHEGKKPFKCEFCDACFSCKSAMKDHIIVIHERKKLFKCEFCEKVFSLKKKMTYHMKSIHLE